jgi:undecaprenyl diphosphate synthase
MVAIDSGLFLLWGVVESLDAFKISEQYLNNVACSLEHLAIIMDGNGRWAQSHDKARIEGHRMGARSVRMVVEECVRLGIKYLTLYAFSTENWHRPEDEVSALMGLLELHLLTEIEELCRNGVRVRVIGDRSRLSASVCDAINSAEEISKDNDALNLILAVSYGARQEIVDAVRKIGKMVEHGNIRADEIDERLISNCLYAPDVPDPDLLIRTSNEYRISNFLLWQIAYTEIVISPLNWPELSKEAFHDCLIEYMSRQRRFGLTSEQLEVDSQTTNISKNGNLSGVQNSFESTLTYKGAVSAEAKEHQINIENGSFKQRVV